MLKLPMKALVSSWVERNMSEYLTSCSCQQTAHRQCITGKRFYSAEKLGPVMFPCLPDKSPTSHLKGESLSQAGTSVALYGSKWEPVVVQLLSEMGNLWMWYTGRRHGQSMLGGEYTKKEPILTERTSSGRRTRDGDLHVGACAVGARLDNNSSADRGVSLVGQLGDVLSASRVVLNDGSIACEG